MVEERENEVNGSIVGDLAQGLGEDLGGLSGSPPKSQLFPEEHADALARSGVSAIEARLTKLHLQANPLGFLHDQSSTCQFERLQALRYLCVPRCTLHSFPLISCYSAMQAGSSGYPDLTQWHVSQIVLLVDR